MISNPCDVEPWDVPRALRDLCEEMLEIHTAGSIADAETAKRWHKSLFRAARAHSVLAQSCEDIVEMGETAERLEAMKQSLTTAMGQSRYWARIDRW